MLNKQEFMSNKQLKSFLVGLAVSVLVIASFFVGGLADRIFVIKPLDYLAKRPSATQDVENRYDAGVTSLGQMIDGQFVVPDIAEASSESVVTVSIHKQQAIIEPQSLFDQFGFFGFPRGETRIEEIQQDIGTGFVVRGNLVVTNKHVVSDTNAEYQVIDKDEQEYQVTQIYRDPSLDMAILQVEGFEAPALALGDSDQLRVGEPVIAIGTALGQFRHTVTAGVISGLGRTITATGPTGFENLENVIQTDASINPGNSGGPLINARGEVIGVNVATTGAENISFAIPINVVKAALENFEKTGEFDRPMLGIRYTVISERAALFNEVPQGAYVIEVIQGGSAEQAGLQQGDIITKFNNERIDEENELARLVNQQSVGAKVTLEVWREGHTQTIDVTLKNTQDN
jgi:S1-C subfamily serine protease